MSWSFPPIKNMKPDEAMKIIDANTCPIGIKDYVRAGVAGLVAKHGPDSLVTISGYGHVCNERNSFEVTSCTLEVRAGGS